MIVKASVATAIETGRITVLHRLIQQPREILHPSGNHRRWTQPWTPKTRDENHDGLIAIKVYEIDPPSGIRMLVTKCHVIVTTAEQTTAGTITYDTARAEGYRTTADWKTSWVRRHDAWGNQHEKIARTIAPTADPSFWIDDADLIRRFDDRHADKPVWRCTFEVDPVDAPRWLHRSSDELYTGNASLALADPDGSRPEAVEESYQRQFSSEAVQNERAQAKLRWEKDRAQLVSALEGFRRNPLGRDVMGDLHVMQERLKQIDRKLAA